MKKPGLVAASVAAASATATSRSSSSTVACKSQIQNFPQDAASSSETHGSSSSREAPSKDRFAPRFDGLRFIETLVTAHR